MNAWTVLMDWAHQPDGGRCPFGLLLPVDHGNGAIVHRCEGKMKHGGAHWYTQTHCGDIGTFTHVKVEWYGDYTLSPDWEPPTT